MGIRKKMLQLVLVVMSLQMTAQPNSELEQPKLVIGIVVDQMRWDYLYRYNERYGETGFKRLLREGFSFEDCKINYIPTLTAIGHSSIYTGSVPSIHGIAANDFYIQKTGKSVYCTRDDAVRSVGTKDPQAKVGKMSPHRLKATTIADELRLATNFRAKTIGVALKDRGSILPAGHTANAAYWFDKETGNWITSSWYTEELPAWLVEYNKKEMPKKYLSKDWNTLYPIETYTQSIKDDNDYEQRFFKDEKPLFPIKTSEIVKKKGLGMIAATPYGNTITFEMAKLAIENEELGKDNITDMLTISLSSPDYIGHTYSPNSIKVEDNYLRLDQELGEFFSFLDEKLGPGNYTVFLTADHGATLNSQFMNDNKLPSGRWNYQECKKELNLHLMNKFGVEKAVLSLKNYQVNFNYNEIPADVNMEKLRSECVAFIENIEGVAYAVDVKKIDAAALVSTIKEKIINGYNRENSGEIQIILKTGWYSGGRRGANHGTWNPDDSHIPLVFMGWGIKQGRCSNKEVYMTDIAPTIAALLRIQMPNGCIGKSLF